jgi:hypothetical protein
MISHRTKVALAAAKERGVALGNPKLSKARKSAVASIRAPADQHATNVLPVIREIRRAGATSLHQIAGHASEKRGRESPSSRGPVVTPGSRWRAQREQLMKAVAVKVLGQVRYTVWRDSVVVWAWLTGGFSRTASKWRNITRCTQRHRA